MMERTFHDSRLQAVYLVYIKPWQGLEIKKVCITADQVASIHLLALCVGERFSDV